MPADSTPRGVAHSVRAALAAAVDTIVSRAALLAVNVPAAFGAYRRHSDIAYGPDPRQRLDLYVPREAAGSRPVVVFWHGGRWRYGDKGEYRFVGAALAALGCVAVLPNYRRYPQVKLAGFMQDAARAALWAAAHARESEDPERLFLMGHSAGAHLAALLALDTRHFAGLAPAPPIAGVIGLSGPYDFLPVLEADLQDMFGPAERYSESQPITFARPAAPPMLLMHGDSDETVWPRNSRNLAAALQARGVAVRLRMLPNAKHADTVAALSIPGRRRAPVLAEVAAFIESPV